MELQKIIVLATLLTLVNSQHFGTGKDLLNIGPKNLLEDAIATAAKFLEKFKEFKANFKKTYANHEEEKQRFNIFQENLKFIIDFEKNRKLSYKLKLNELADLTEAEWKRLSGLKVTKADLFEDIGFPRVKRSGSFDINKDVDWNATGAVLPARNQGQCGSCYAFASAAALEALYFNQTGKLEYLSPQRIMDCGFSYGTNGCNGGHFEGAFHYVKDNGICNETAYKYEEKELKSCQKSNNVGVKLSGFSHVFPMGDELEETLSKKGPVVVGIDANPKSLAFYSDGIYYEPSCQWFKVNHAVLLVGYGTESNGEKYWLIKNSWGTSWGINGFLKLSRKDRNHCGIRSIAYSVF